MDKIIMTATINGQVLEVKVCGQCEGAGWYTQADGEADFIAVECACLDNYNIYE